MVSLKSNTKNLKQSEMKSMTNHFNPGSKTNLGKIHFGDQDLSDEIKIIDFLEETEPGQYIISLYSPLFSGSKLKVFIRGNKIVLFITEYVESIRPAAMYVSDWQSFYPQSYVRMRNISLNLPDDNFFLLRHFMVPEKYLLRILLAKHTDN